MPHNKEDVEAAKTIAELGFPAALPVLDLIIRWLRVAGSPVESVFSQFLAKNPESCPSAVGKFLGFGKCDTTKHVLVTSVVSNWPREHIASVAWALQTLLTHTSFHATDLECIALLEKHSLSNRAWLAEWTEFKIRRLEAHLSFAMVLRKSCSGP